MRVVEEPPNWGKGRHTRYNQFLDGQIWLIEDGDFDVPTSSLRSALWKLAKSRGTTVKTRYVEGEGLYVQAGL